MSEYMFRSINRSERFMGDKRCGILLPQVLDEHSCCIEIILFLSIA